MKQKKIFLICPVKYGDHIKTKEDEETQKKILLYVEKLEKAGNKIHWPKRDTDQNDPIGLNICTENAQAAIIADEIHIWWDPGSEGVKFDFGISFVLHILNDKKIIPANPEEVKPTKKKSFNNVLLALHAETMGGKEMKIKSYNQ